MGETLLARMTLLSSLHIVPPLTHHVTTHVHPSQQPPSSASQKTQPLHHNKVHHPLCSSHTVSFSTPLISLSILPLQSNATLIESIHTTHQLTETITTSTPLPHHFVLFLNPSPIGCWLLLLIIPLPFKYAASLL